MHMGKTVCTDIYTIRLKIVDTLFPYILAFEVKSEKNPQNMIFKLNNSSEF